MLTPKNSSKKRARSKRVDAPVGKQQYMDKEESTKPSRVDAPAGKQQYMDKEESTKPSRVDAPVGKGQYMDSEEKPKPSRGRPSGQNTQSSSSSRPHRTDYPGQGVQDTTHRPIRTEEQHLDKDALAAADKSTVSVYYMVTATSFGNYKAKVLDLMVGKDRTRKDSEYVAPFTCNYYAEEKVLEMVEKISLLGAKMLVKKTIIIDIPLVSM